MSTPRFIADCHFGHRNIAKFRNVFINAKHNDLYFMYLLRSICTKRDTMFFLGDICFTEDSLNYLKDLPGNKILVMGNHDAQHFSTKLLFDVFDDVQSLIKYKEMWLSHAPIHKDELRGKKNVHGHVHQQSVQDSDYLNVSVDSTFMKLAPRTLYEIREALHWQEELSTFLSWYRNII